MIARSLIGFLWAASSPTWAAPPAADAKPAAEAKPTPDTGKRGSVVKGEFLEPEITVVISRENLNKAYDLELDQNFLDKIVASVEQEPF